MPNNKSTEKRVRQDLKRTIRNRTVKSQVKTAVRRFEDLLPTDKTAAQDKLRVALKTVDKAVTKGVIHKNKAARQKSRLMKKFNNQ
ncbi:30S ribosomal protein S20 [Clostridium sp. 'deep sea']|uniref:30S ribosomal protein S20 n=1 Tax=Clostridium sp. 'deep sea' TaxID=2779445 RepID=UPI001896A11D|nr:30S ribosomal protein S20 [Clostridium sp. 'deep sea']QOR34339.1 30S ribosomal protein S20 [Clostridium sp. 'deep sea']